MLGIYRINGDKCRLLLGHGRYVDDGLDFAYDTAVAIRKAFLVAPMVDVIIRRKISVRQDGQHLYLRNGDGQPTVWRTEMPMEDVHGWLAHFLFLTDLDEWCKETVPKKRAHIMPMRALTEWSDGRPKWADATIGKGKRQRSVWKTPIAGESTRPYTSAWSFLMQLGHVAHDAPVPLYPEIAALCDRNGLEPRRRLRVAD